MKTSTNYLLLSIVSTTILCTMCVSTKNLVRSNDGSYLINHNYIIQKGMTISQADAFQLGDMTLEGSNETTVVHKTVKNDWVNETVWKHKDAKLNESLKTKVDRILTKYTPEITQDGNYFIKDNLVIQKSTSISFEDASKLDAITVVGVQETEAVHKTVKSDWVNETVWKHKNITGNLEVKVKVDQIMQKYSLR